MGYNQRATRSSRGVGDALSALLGAPMKQLLAYQRKLTEARQFTAKLDGRLSKLEQVRSPGLPCANPTCVRVDRSALPGRLCQHWSSRRDGSVIH